jgi:hypothetical protein
MELNHVLFISQRNYGRGYEMCEHGRILRYPHLSQFCRPHSSMINPRLTEIPKQTDSELETLSVDMTIWGSTCIAAAIFSSGQVPADSDRVHNSLFDEKAQKELPFSGNKFCISRTILRFVFPISNLCLSFDGLIQIDFRMARIAEYAALDSWGIDPTREMIKHHLLKVQEYLLGSESRSVS